MRSFFPTLITAPFQAGLRATFDFAIVASLVAAGGVVDARREGGGRWGGDGPMGGSLRSRLMPPFTRHAVTLPTLRKGLGGDGP